MRAPADAPSARRRAIWGSGWCVTTIRGVNGDLWWGGGRDGHRQVNGWGQKTLSSQRGFRSMWRALLEQDIPAGLAEAREKQVERAGGRVSDGGLVASPNVNALPQRPEASLEFRPSDVEPGPLLLEDALRLNSSGSYLVALDFERLTDR